jgi:ATP-binding cassette, subfamily B, bacterial PglK
MINNSNNLNGMLHILWKSIGSKRRLQFIFLIILTIFTAVMELISIGAVLPFIMILSSPEKVLSVDWIKTAIDFMGFENDEKLKLIITIIFCAAALIAGISRLVHLWYQTRLGHLIGADIGKNIYEVTLNKPFSFHASRNSSEIISAISNKTIRVVYEVILPVLSILSSLTIFLIVLSILIFFNPILISLMFSVFGLIYISVSFFTKKKLQKYGLIVSKNQNTLVKIVQEGLGGIRDVILEGSQNKYLDKFVHTDEPLKSAQGNILFISSSPRFVVESLGMISIALIAYFLMNENGETDLILPTLATLAVGAQRLLPLMQLFYFSLSTAKGGAASLKDIVTLIDETPKNKMLHDERVNFPFKFENKIELIDIHYSYPGCSVDVLSGFSLKIKKGENIGFIGETGCGKSTLLDLIMGLLQESKGQILIDDVRLNSGNRPQWRKYIAHVPQNIFLFDSTIANNICFSSEINYELLYKVCAISELTSVIKMLPKGYNTVVGERGAKLSGGQKQRIGIARALYRRTPILIMDEATSALDIETEKRIIESIEREFKELTIINVAHRLSSLKYCNRIIELKDGAIKNA